MGDVLRVGMVLGNEPDTAYCGGAFGRDTYGPFRVEAIGSDWVVVREWHSSANILNVFFYQGDPEWLLQYVPQSMLSVTPVGIKPWERA